MGLIRTALADFAGEVRNDTGWLNRGDDADYGGPVSASGVRVNRSSAMSLSTFWRCVDLIQHTVALAPRDVVVKIGSQSFPEYTPPTWLSTPNPNDPNYSGDDYFAEQTLSMLTDGNTFVDVYPYVWDPQVLTVLDPQKVNVIKGPRYEILDDQGRVVRTLTPMNILHGWWFRFPGELRGVSPLEKLRRDLGGAIAANEFGARFFGQGAALSFGVEVPYAMDPVKLAGLKESLRAKYVGLRNSHAIGVLADGGKFVTGLAPTPEQAQMLETRKYGVEDVCRIFGVPPGMAGSNEPGASSYASAVAWRQQFRDDSVLKFTSKLERLHERMLQVPAGIADPTAKVQLRFNLDWVARADLLSRYQAHTEGVRGGLLTPDEARGYEDLPPMPGGDQLFMQQQMVPIADLGKTKATEPLNTQPKPAGAPRSFQPVVNVTLADGAIRSEFAPPNIVVNPPDVRVESPVTISEGAVQYHAAPITVEPADVAITVQPADVVIPEQRAIRKTIERDAAGRITGVTEAPEETR